MGGVVWCIYSHHASDPASGKLLNVFDMVRLHKFGELDEKASFKATAEFAVADGRVSAALPYGSFWRKTRN